MGLAATGRAGDGELPAVAALTRLINGYQVSQAIHVAATLGIADLLKDGPRTAEELAAAAGANAGALYRLLRALASVGILREREDGAFESTPLSDHLRSDAPESLAGWAAFMGLPSHWEAWGQLLHSVRTGENAFRHVHGTDVWTYRAGKPEESALFDAAMTALTGRDHHALLEAYDFGRFGTIVDVGGGRGALLAAILRKHPGVQGVLFDQPHVVERARDVLEPAGVAERCRVVAGSFFESVPEGGDAYVMKSIIHDWEDAEATAILQVCRRAVGSDGRVLLLEREMGPPNEGREAKFSDLNMLVAPGGRERTTEEYASLFERAGFRLAGVTHTRTAMSLFEAAPV